MEITPFDTVIKDFLDKRAQEDTQFAVSYAKPNKNIEECCKYIIQEVEKARKNNARCVPVKSEEVFSLAVHYYDEDDIVVNGPKNQVKVEHNKPVEETAEIADKPEEKRKTRKPRKSKATVDPNIPEPLDIPIF